MLHILDFVFLTGYDLDILGLSPGKYLQGNPKYSLAGYVERVLKRKEQGMQKDEVSDKGKDWLRYSFWIWSWYRPYVETYGLESRQN